MTASETRVWLYLRGRRLDGWKFRRQHPIGPYVVDFYCPAVRLVVELDGDSHDGTRDGYEDRRQAWLESKGYRVLRLSADYPEDDPIEGVWDAIDLALSQAATNIPRSRSSRHLDGFVLPTCGEVSRSAGGDAQKAGRMTSRSSLNGRFVLPTGGEVARSAGGDAQRVDL